MSEVSPMVAQYRRVKKELPEKTLLCLKLGDFVEFFEDDAKTVSEICRVTLTHRRYIPMCGIPYHATESYFHALLKAGWKVAVADFEPLTKGATQ